jgi:AcrR family transcriptional regulator
MLDGTNPRDRIIRAALHLCEMRGWRDLSLGEIAKEAGIPLAELRHSFQSKAQILAAFSHAADLAVLKRFPAPGPDAPRDRLFDVILTRFEVMEPYKAALRRLRDDLAASPGAALSQLRPALKSQYWMLAAAGISGEGGFGLLRVQGLLAVYSTIFPVWLNDDDPGMARTMAALDRRLRRGESAIRRIERFRDGLENLARAVTGKRREEKPAEAHGGNGTDTGSAPLQV